ncbi:MAG: hypothetical protein EP297_01615 [Gammaproteobacteria bacterium]|nr:MAG: hypothetical protein EP297_01615 [Gammaproteobacteria bacterium]
MSGLLGRPVLDQGIHFAADPTFGDATTPRELASLLKPVDGARGQAGTLRDFRFTQYPPVLLFHFHTKYSSVLWPTHLTHRGR